MNYWMMIRILTFLMWMTSVSCLAQTDLKSGKKAVDTLFFVNKEKALAISNRLLPIARETKDTFHITYFLDQAGEINRYFGNLYDAEAQLRECLHFKKNWKDLKDLSLTHNNLGKTYKLMGDYDKAQFHFLKALKLMETDKNLIGQGFYLNNIAVVFDEQKNYPKAIEYYKRSLELKKTIRDTAGIASSTYNLGLSYFNLGNYEKALSYFRYSYESASYQKDANKKARVLESIGRTYLQIKKYDLAEEKLLAAYALKDELDDFLLKTSIINTLGEFYTVTGKLDKAMKLNSIALNMLKNKGASDKMQATLFARSAIFKKQSQPDSALYYLELGNLYYDSLVSEANINAVANMEAKYNLEHNELLRKNSEIKALKTKELLNKSELGKVYLILILFLLISASLLILIKYTSKRRNMLLIEGQKNLITHQFNRQKQLNEKLKSEINNLKISIQDKEHILDSVFRSNQSVLLPPELTDLSPREKEVLAYLALGLSNEQLAQRLFVSQATIKTHLGRIYAKLLVQSRSEAVAIANKYGLLGELVRETSA